MPPIKRWFAVSHDLNRDPDIRMLCRKFGCSGLRIWLEILSIADRNGGALPGPFRGYLSILAGASESTPRHVEAVLLWLSSWLRADSKGTTWVLNYGKYNRTAESYPLPPDLTIPDLTDSDKNQNPEAPSAGSLKLGKKIRKRGLDYMAYSMGLIPELKEQSDRLYNSDPVKYRRLAAWLAQGRKLGYLETDMAEALRQFWDYRLIDEWYPYLDTVLTKVVKDRSIAESTAEHERFKAEIKEMGDSARNGDSAVKPVLSVIRGLSDAKKAN